MKKLLTILMMMTVCTYGANAANSYTKSVKNAIKQDINNAKTQTKQNNQALKNAVKKDIDNKIQADTKARQDATAAKKAEKIKQIDGKLTQLNKQKETIENDKNITLTEKTVRLRTVQNQIDFYTKQKEALK